MFDVLKRKIFYLVGKALLTAINNTGKTGFYDSGARANPQRVSTNWFGNLTDIERSQPYGFESYPVIGTSKGIYLSPDGVRSNVFCIMVQDDAYRPIDLASGDTCQYDSRDNRVWLKDGKLHIVVDGDVEMEITGDLKVKGDIIANHDTTSISLVNHFHLGNLGYNTGIPETGAGVAPPAVPPTVNGVTNNIVDGNGTESTNHTHNETGAVTGVAHTP